MKLEVGDTYFDASNSSQIRHLYFILAIDSELVTAAAVNITSNRSDKDQTCIIQSGEHPRITKESVVFFRESRLLKYEILMEDLQKGFLKKSVKASPELMNKIIEASKISKFIPKEVKFFIIENTPQI